MTLEYGDISFALFDLTFNNNSESTELPRDLSIIILTVARS
jgi:hypothetical protein